MIYPKNPFCPLNDDCMCPGNGNDNNNNSNNNNSNNNNNNNNNNIGGGNNNNCGQGGNMTQNEMLKKIMELEFAVTDLNLYLDTHPENREALEMLTKLAASLKSLMYDYSKKYEPLTVAAVNNETPFEWVTGKWPWQA